MTNQSLFALEAQDLPADLLHAVRTALMHLYDNAYLQNHPLAGCMTAHEAGDCLSRAQDLRRVLLDCIETLRPQAAAHGDAARAYAVLTYRCVDGLPMGEIEEKLGLSRRQTYREYTKGIEAVARQLWDQLRLDAQREPVADDARLVSNHTMASRRALAAAELSRLGKEARREPIPLPDVVEGVCLLLESRLQQRGIQVTKTGLAALAPVVADRTLLRQALLNLLSHALDTAPNPRELVISAQDTGSAVQLTIGLLPDAAGVRAVHAPYPREGVAFSVAQSLLAAQNGELNWTQTDAKWQATIVLPTAQPPTILIIDDNEDLVELFRRYLAGHLLEVVGATSGRAAVALLDHVSPQLILLDVMMPQQDGWEVLQTLRAKPNLATTPIVVCSVLREHALALTLGASDTLVKPVSQSALLDVLRRWLGPLRPNGSA